MTEDMIAIVGFFTTLMVLGIGIPLVRAYVRRSERSGQLPAMDADASARLARIEAAVESIAIEIERISEGQRFTTQLLAERSATASVRVLPASGAGPAGEPRTAPRENVR